jgi:hypothetical protein
MAEHTRWDGNDPERAPEETALDTWVEESGVYLTIPSPVRPDVERRRTPGSPAGARHLRRVGAIRL